MKVAIIGAMEQEIALLRDQIENYYMIQCSGIQIYIGQIKSVNVALLKSSIGKVAAAVGTTILLQYFQPDIVINIGSAGSIANKLKIGDIVISEEVRYHDADVTVFGYEHGQMAGCPAAFLADSALISLAEDSIEQFNLNAIRGLICSGDSFINGAELLVRIRAVFPSAIAVDMEAAAIGHVCYLFGTPFVVVRVISDVSDNVSHISFGKFLTVAAKQSTMIVNAMLQDLSKRSRI